MVSTSRAGGMPALQLARRGWQAAAMRLSVRGQVEVGERFRLGQGSVITSAHGLRFGNDVSVGRGCTIEVCGEIGDFVLISARVGIVGRQDHALDEVGRPMRYSTWVGDRPCIPKDRVSIGDDVWIGYAACLLSGVRIGNGAVIAAGSLVTRDVAPYEVVGGNPARHLGERFADPAVRRRHEDALARWPRVPGERSEMTSEQTATPHPGVGHGA